MMNVLERRLAFAVERQARVDAILAELKERSPDWYQLLQARVDTFRSGNISPDNSLQYAESVLSAVNKGGTREQYEKERWYRNFPYDLPPGSASLKKHNAKRLYSILLWAGVPKDLRELTWDDVEDRPDVLGFGKAAVELRSYSADTLRHRRDGVGVGLYGPVGVGKTLFAYLILRAAAVEGLSVFIVRSSTYVDSLKPGGESLREKAAAVDYLVLDDLGSELGSDFADVQIEALISARYDSNKPMLTTANLSPNELAEEYDPRIFDRLKRNYKYVLDGVSYRDRQKPASPARL